MNCRRVCGLLSAYVDSELGEEDTLAVRSHLGECPHCRMEHQSLVDTKRLVASLAQRASRAEIEALLHCDSTAGNAPAGSGVRSILRPRPLAATALLSLAGLWLASTTVDRGSPDIADTGSAGMPAMASVNAGFLSVPVYSGPGGRWNGAPVVPPAAPMLGSAVTALVAPGQRVVSGAAVVPVVATPPGGFVGVAASSEMMPTPGPYGSYSVSVRGINTGNGTVVIFSSPSTFSAVRGYLLPRR